ITQFIGNINNFNVIYLLSGGGPGDLLKYTSGAKGTDLLITWLYKLSLGSDRNYKLASVIGILVFIISATFSLLVYNKSFSIGKSHDNCGERGRREGRRGRRGRRGKGRRGKGRRRREYPRNQCYPKSQDQGKLLLRKYRN
ncbi:MAG: hypothetical protein K6F28_08925, partial [Lachnospiraceae bacterium]|nr:hypothetical protein [Lachnospiraceae bacterium]